MQETPVRFLDWEDPLEKDRLPIPVFLSFPCGSAGKESACNVETWVQFLGWKDPLKKGKATQSSILTWRIPWIFLAMGSQSLTRLINLHFHTVEVARNT